MAGEPLLVDTDVFIDYLRDISPARALLDSTNSIFTILPGLERNSCQSQVKGIRTTKS